MRYWRYHITTHVYSFSMIKLFHIKMSTLRLSCVSCLLCFICRVDLLVWLPVLWVQTQVWSTQTQFCYFCDVWVTGKVIQQNVIQPPKLTSARSHKLELFSNSKAIWVINFWWLMYFPKIPMIFFFIFLHKVVYNTAKMINFFIAQIIFSTLFQHSCYPASFNILSLSLRRRWNWVFIYLFYFNFHKMELGSKGPLISPLMQAH
jgi:hypothetical protein